jgi:hypothetical protein
MSWRKTYDVRSFDPETVEMLADAIETAIARIKEQGRLPVEDEDAFRSAIGKYVVDSAKRGERNPQN